jgi:parallel beta-helix repeat protein
MRCTSAILLPACTLLILGLVCGLAGAAEYGADSGIDDITDLNCSIWSTLLSNNGSTVTCDINVNSGALNLINATIRMGSGKYINVKSGATMNVTDGSNITRDSGNYYFNYESGSRGNLSASIIEYSYKLDIATANNITITGCTIRNNQNHGIHLTSTSGYVNITDCTIENTVLQHGIFIESSQNNILRNNSLNNNRGDYSLYVTGDYDQEIDITNTVNGGKVYYRCNESETITDPNIGHATIADCTNLWFTGCTIHNGDGVRIVGSSSSGISGSTIENNTEQGVYFVDSSNNTINDSHILDNSKQGIYSTGSSSCNRIINNSIINNGIGIYLDGNGDNNLRDNNVSENGGYGIQLGSENGDHLSEQNILHNNNVQSNNATGIVFYTNCNRLTENSISDNRDFAFALYSDSSTYFYYNYIWRNNTANGEEVNYYHNERDITLDSKYLSASNVCNVGKITLIDCTNITVRDSELSNNIRSGCGMFLWNSSNNSLTNNTLSNNYNGIRLHDSSSNNITDLDTISPRDGAQFESNSSYNHITDSSFAATAEGSNGMSITASEHTVITNTTISSVDRYGLSAADAHYTNLANVTITASSSDGIRLYASHHVTIRDGSSITANNTGVYCANGNHLDIIDTTITAGTDGIYMSESHWGNLTNNIIDAGERGIALTGSRDHNLTANNITNYASIGILLEEYSTNTTMIGNDLTCNGSEFDIRINDSNGAAITNNESTAANYTFYLTGNISLCTLDTVFNKTKVGYEDTSNLTLMWRIDVLCWDNYHQEPMWTNLTVRYRDISDYNESLCWEGETSNANGRLSNNAFNDYGPPTSSSNWLPVIEYKQNASKKMIYQPMNCTAVNRWDVLNKIYDRRYKNLKTAISGPGVTILVDAGHTPNGKCYYCHGDKLKYADGTYKFPKTTHWIKYNESIMYASMDDPYTPGRCIDCHNETDSLKMPHGNASGKDLLYQQSPQLCYNGKGDQTCHNSSAVKATLNQKEEFNQTTHHPLGDGKLACKACHDNHGSKHDPDLLRRYETTSSGGYNSSNYALCFVCHLEEKIVAKMSGETGHLAKYMNQTNFRDEYYLMEGFGTGIKFKNIHSPQNEINSPMFDSIHPMYNCYSCHNPHGSDNPATTRYRDKQDKIFNYTYITNVSPTNNITWEVLDYANWNDSTMNKGGGTYDSNCGCHGTYKLQTDRFTYREFIDYEPAGGAGCLECHDNGRSGAIRPIVNLSAVKIAMHNNLSWWALEDVDADLPGTDKNFTRWLEDRGYANTSLDRNNSICWACHSTNGTPPSPGFHPDRALNPYKCPKCHGPYEGQPPHTKGVVKAIDNHGPTTKGIGSIFIQTDVGNNGSCGDCHAPSRLSDDDIGDLEVWKYTDENKNVIKDFVDYTGRTTMGDVSHYGLNRSQGIDILGSDSPNILCNTSDCLFCHCNTTNGQIWGNAPDVTDNMYGADTSNLSECYTYCHVLPDYLYNVTEDTIPHFHNKSLYAGGGFDCVVCHDLDSSYGIQSLVDADAIAAGIHGNVTNNTISDVLECDSRSKACWGCHNSDGMQPEGMGDRNFIYQPQKKPWSCEDCHARSDEWNAATSYGETWISSSYPPNQLPPRIYTHYPNSATLKTNMSHGRCIDCHNNSINQSHADTHGQMLGNTLSSNVSHYGTTADLIHPTENCGICHNNTTNGLIWGDAPQNEHGNFTDYSNSEDGCFVCHTNDNQTPVDFHAANLWSGKGGFDCLRCHEKDGFAKNKRINGSVFGEAMHWNTNNISLEYGLNRSCWVCHFEDGLNADMHYTRMDPPYLCYDCHRKTVPPFDNVSAAPEVHNHFKNGTNISSYWTCPTDSDSCMGCHNQSEMKYAFTENDTYRTTFSVVSHYGNNRTDIADLFVVNNNTAYCSYCHVNTSTPFMEFENDMNIRHAGSQDCNDCHGDGRLHDETLTRAQTSGNCTDCHALYGVNKTGTVYEINVTAMNLGVHENVNENMTDIALSEVSDANNAKCWGCHVPDGAYPESGHEDTFNNDAYLCYDCHNGTYAYQNVTSATAVYNHFKGGINITARTDAETNSSSCGSGCHNLSTMKVPGFDAGGNATYRVNMSQSSHYPWNRTDIILASNLSNCAWCHRNSTNEFIDIFLYAGPPNYTANIQHATKTSGCIVSECHDRGRIHDSSLKIPTLNWSEACKSCHFELDDSDAYVNETMFNASVHETVDCTECHVNTQMNHPIEEYTWKWCECCHSYQSDPINESDRHNVTADPANYSAKDVNVLTITECTECHNATSYENSKQNFNSSTEHECRWCHSYPDDW